MTRTLLAVSVLVLAGCSSAPQATPSSTPATTVTTTTNNAANRASCGAFDQAMHRTVDMVDTVKRHGSLPMFMMSSAVRDSVEGVNTAARAADGPLHDAMQHTSTTLGLLDAKIQAWRDGSLDIAPELTAVYGDVGQVQRLCVGTGVTMSNQIPTRTP